MNADILILKQAAVVMICLFGVAGAITLAARNTGWGRDMGFATVSWAVICALFLLVPYAGPIPFSLLMSGIAILAVREFYKMSGICGLGRLPYLSSPWPRPFCATTKFYFIGFRLLPLW